MNQAALVCQDLCSLTITFASTVSLSFFSPPPSLFSLLQIIATFVYFRIKLTELENNTFPQRSQINLKTGLERQLPITMQ